VLADLERKGLIRRGSERIPAVLLAKDPLAAPPACLARAPRAMVWDSSASCR
jgi:hypothetical protein